MEYYGYRDYPPLPLRGDRQPSPEMASADPQPEWQASSSYNPRFVHLNDQEPSEETRRWSDHDLQLFEDMQSGMGRMRFQAGGQSSSRQPARPSPEAFRRYRQEHPEPYGKTENPDDVPVNVPRAIPKPMAIPPYSVYPHPYHHPQEAPLVHSPQQGTWQHGEPSYTITASRPQLRDSWSDIPQASRPLSNSYEAQRGSYPVYESQDTLTHSIPPPFPEQSFDPSALPKPPKTAPPPLRAFKPSPHPFFPHPPSPLRPTVTLAGPSRPPSDRPILPAPEAEFKTTSKPRKGSSKEPIEVPDSGSDTKQHSSSKVTPRTAQRTRRAKSGQPSSSTTSPEKTETPSPYQIASLSKAVQCSGFTRKGQPCRRMVKMEAPSLSMVDQNLPEEEGIRRYCKDHAGLICDQTGFYWKDKDGASNIWIEFDNFIPSDLSLQTRTLMRTTMETPLTEKESRGSLYAYELRDLNTQDTVYFKVGRTDNVPRRMGEWATRCKSHKPTLRDIFPVFTTDPARAAQVKHMSGADIDRHPSARVSYLSGAFRQSDNPARTCPAVKRWERLVHLELADRSASTAPGQYDKLKEKCDDCQVVHREIFPLGRDGSRDGNRMYEEVVVEIINRWESFVRKISEE